MSMFDRVCLSGYRICAIAASGDAVVRVVEHGLTMAQWRGVVAALVLVAWVVFRCSGDGFDSVSTDRLPSVGLNAAVAA